MKYYLGHYTYLELSIVSRISEFQRVLTLFFLFRVAFLAVNWTVTAWFKRDFTVLVTTRANCLEHFFWSAKTTTLKAHVNSFCYLRLCAQALLALTPMRKYLYWHLRFISQVPSAKMMTSSSSGLSAI